MGFRLTLALSILSSVAFSDSVWIVGEGYTAHFDTERTALTYQAVDAHSWSLDGEECLLWVAEKDSDDLMVLSPNGPSSRGKVRRILSKLSNKKFLTLSTKGLLQERDENGTVLTERSVSWLTDAESVTATQTGAVVLHRNDDARKLWLSHLNLKSEFMKTSVLSQGRDIWGNSRMEWDPTTQSLWVGYAITSGGHSYTPVVNRLNEEGKIQSTISWKERGLLFDICVEPMGGLLISRDVPTSPFTVPLKSFVEKLPQTGKPEVIYSAPQNEIIDSLSCDPERLYFAQHSLLGGGSSLRVWERETKKIKEITKLRGRARKIFSCKPKT
jgi:hypothetical protein